MIVCLLWSCVSAVHPPQVSLAEAEWNAKTGCLEVALRIEAREFLPVLRRAAGGDLDVADEKAMDAALPKFVVGHVQIRRSKKAEPQPLRWVGHERERGDLWLYFEIPLPASDEPLTGLHVRNTLLVEDAPRQVNTMTFKLGDRRRSQHFWRDHTDRQFSWKPAEDEAPPTHAHGSH